MAEALSPTEADKAVAERYRRGYGGRYDRLVDELAADFARHRLAAYRQAVDDATDIAESYGDCQIADAISALRDKQCPPKEHP